MRTLKQIGIAQGLQERQYLVKLLKPYMDTPIKGIPDLEDKKQLEEFKSAADKYNQDADCLLWVWDNCPHAFMGCLLENINVWNGFKAQVAYEGRNAGEAMESTITGAKFFEGMKHWMKHDDVAIEMGKERADYFRWRMEFFGENVAQAAKKIGLKKDDTWNS